MARSDGTLLNEGQTDKYVPDHTGYVNDAGSRNHCCPHESCSHFTKHGERRGWRTQCDKHNASKRPSGPNKTRKDKTLSELNRMAKSPFKPHVHCPVVKPPTRRVLSWDMAGTPKVDNYHVNSRKCWVNPKKKRNRRKGSKLERKDLKDFEEHATAEVGVQSEPEQAFSLSTFLKANLPGGEHLEALDKVIDILENFFHLFVITSDVSTPTAFLSSCCLWYKATFKTEMVVSLRNYIIRLILPMTEQEGDGEETRSTKKLLECLRDVRTNWHTVFCGPFAEHISKFLGLLVVLGVCEATSVTFKLKEFEMIGPDLVATSKNAPDLITFIMDVALFFMERFDTCLAQGSILPMFSDSEFQNMDAEFGWVKSNWPLVKSGEERGGVTKKEFDRRLHDLATRYQSMIPRTERMEKAIICSKYNELCSYLAASRSMDLNATNREVPFTFGIFGTTNIGKTTMINKFVEIIAKSKQVQVPCGDNYTYTLKEGQKHWNGWKNYMNCIIMDDFGNRKPDRKEASSTNVIVDVVNGVRFQPPMAEIEEKAHADCRPDFVVFTGHDKTCGAIHDSICPGSIQRRIQHVISAKLRPEFCIEVNGCKSGVASNLVQAHYDDLRRRGVPFFLEDTCLYTVQTVVSNPNGDRYLANYQNVVHNNVELVDVTAQEVIPYLIESCVKHRAAQKRMKENERADATAGLEFCPVENCPHYAGFCPDHVQITPGQVVFQSDQPPIQNEDVLDDESDSNSMPDLHFSKPKDDGDDDSSYTYSDDDDDCYEELRLSADVLAMYHQDERERKMLARKYPDDEPLDLCDMDEQMGMSIFSNLESRLINSVTSIGAGFFRRKVASTLSRKKDFSKMGLLAAANHVWNIVDWLQFVPTSWIENDHFQSLLSVVETDNIWDLFKEKMWDRASKDAFWIVILISSLFCTRNTFGIEDSIYDKATLLIISSSAVHRCVGSFLMEAATHWLIVAQCCLAMYCARRLVDTVVFCKGAATATKAEFFERLKSRNDVSTFIKNETRDRIISNTLMVGGASIALYLTIKLMREMKHIWQMGFEKWVDSKLGFTTDLSGTSEVGAHKDSVALNNLNEHGFMDGCNAEAVAERNKVKSQWLVPKIVRPNLDYRAKTTNIENLAKGIENNLCHVTFETTAGRKHGNALFLNSNIFAIPRHYFRDCEVSSVSFVKHDNVNGTNRTFESKLSSHSIYKHPTADLAFVHIQRGSALFSDIRHFLPESSQTKGQKLLFRMLYKDPNGKLEQSHGTALCNSMYNSKFVDFVEMNGAEYTTFTGKLFPGLCGSPVLAGGNGSFIYGIHFMGVDGGTHGACVEITRSTCEEAILDLQSRGLHFSAQPPPLVSKTMGKSVPIAKEIHDKHFMNFLTEETQFVPIAATTPAMKMKSNFKTLPTHDSVKKIFDVQEEFVPPKTSPQYWSFQKWNSKAGNPAKEIDHSIWRAAISDYKETIRPVVENPLWMSTRPLTLHEVLNGIPGRRFIGPLTLSTSCGPPVGGDKKKFVVDIDEPGQRKFTPEICEEYAQFDAKLRRGERLGTYARMFDKDEAHTEEKCRKIYANNMVTNLLVRKYFLPLIEMIQMNPLVFECAVGLNAGSPEWTRLRKHVTKFGVERGFAGDFSGFDQKVCSQWILGAFEILLWIASKCNYDEESLRAMRTLVDELSFPYVDVDGVIMAFLEGTWISGNPLTVIINSIINALLKRSFFLTVYPNRKFANHVAATHYGDDDQGSVSEDSPLYNIKDFTSWLAELGMKFTLPDKKFEGEMPLYLNLDDVDFLKRHDVYHEKLGLSLGALVPSSMHKMMMCCVLQKGNGLDVHNMACINMENALNEAFFHGPEFFEDFRSKCKQVAEECHINGYVEGLNFDYNDRSVEWKKKHYTTALSYFEEMRIPIPEFYVGGA